MRTHCLIVFCFCALIARAEIIDRLAVAVGNQIITELQIDEELRVTAMLNRKAVVRSLEERRDSADRLVEQLLIKQEMDLSRYPLPGSTDVDKYLQQIVDSSGGTADFDKMLAGYNLTVETMRRHLELQLMELRFIDFRFRPDTVVSDSDVEAAYRRQVAGWNASHSGPPPTFEAAREALRAVLVEEQTDAALNTWLGESRKRVNIVYFDNSLE
jgi:parvulin-like peptidyl-prolyl isomerase